MRNADAELLKDLTSYKSPVPGPGSRATGPDFSIIIPVKPGGEVSALAALRRAKETAYPFEVLVAEGKTPSQQRNQAAYQSQGEIIYFLDDDSMVSSDFLSWCAAAFEDRAVAVTGGPSLTPDTDTALQKLFGSALSSLFGAGGVRNRYRLTGLPRETGEQELILCNMAFRRDDFISFGGFDERLYPNEENELLDRIAAAGRKLVHVPEMAVKRSQRESIAAFMRQMFSYGRGRAEQTMLAGLKSLVSFVPLLFVLYLFTLPLAFLWPLWLVPLLLYFLLSAVFALVSVVEEKDLFKLLLLFLFPLMHSCNGLGLLSGFLGGKPKPVARGVVAVKQLKRFGQHNW
jgi:succinoglycan biosynthesis protein ExoA